MNSGLSSKNKGIRHRTNGPRSCRPREAWVFAPFGGSALYSTHQNHIDREGLRLNFEELKSRNRRFSYSLNSTFTSRFTRTITAKKENTELINADRKPYRKR